METADWSAFQQVWRSDTQNAATNRGATVALTIGRKETTMAAVILESSCGLGAIVEMRTKTVALVVRNFVDGAFAWFGISVEVAMQNLSVSSWLGKGISGG
jgi:hypothetical protein